MAFAQETDNLFAGLSGRSFRPDEVKPDTPLVVAIHGGTYTSAYFDAPGASLFARAAALGIPLIAPDRPGYAGSKRLPDSEMTVKGQADYMAHALIDAWNRHGGGTSGVFLVGHSIGGAIAATIAAIVGDEAAKGFPLLGLALSGVCMHTPPEHKPMWESLPDTPTVEMPPGVKDVVMFGPEGSFVPEMVRTAAMADAPAPKAELVDIASTWNDNAPGTLARIEVPVHYRQAEFDKLWIMSQEEVDSFRAALKHSPRVDAGLVKGTGHCMEYHRIGRSLQIQQLAFALQCAVEEAGK